MNHLNVRDALRIVTTVFVDVAGSTKLYHELGNKAALEKIDTAIRIICRMVAKHNGQVIKTIGDEVMCVFQELEHALSSMIELQRTFDRDANNLGFRVSLYSGSVEEVNNDVFGDSVNIASRLNDYALKGEIIIAEEMVRLLPNQYSAYAKFKGSACLKGRPGIVDIYTILLE